MLCLLLIAYPSAPAYSVRFFGIQTYILETAIAPINIATKFKRVSKKLKIFTTIYCEHKLFKHEV